MHLTTDYIRQLWTGLSTDDWGDVEFTAGDVAYIMDQSECWIFDGSSMYQLPDLGGGGGGSTVIYPYIQIYNNKSTNASFSANFVTGGFLASDPDLCANALRNVPNHTAQYCRGVVVTNGKFTLRTTITANSITYNDVPLTYEIVSDSNITSGGNIYIITLPDNFDPDTPIYINYN